MKIYYREIDKNMALSFLLENKAKKEQISLYPLSNKYFAAFDQNTLVGVIGETKGRIKQFYVNKNYRKKGIATELLKKMVVESKRYTAFATINSFNIFIKNGFCTKTVSKNGIHFMEKTYEKPCI